MYRDPLFDEFRRPEREAVEAERQLAEQEALVITSKRQEQDKSQVEGELKTMRANQAFVRKTDFAFSHCCNPSHPTGA